MGTASESSKDRSTPIGDAAEEFLHRLSTGQPVEQSAHIEPSADQLIVSEHTDKSDDDYLLSYRIESVIFLVGIALIAFAGFNVIQLFTGMGDIMSLAVMVLAPAVAAASCFVMLRTSWSFDADPRL